MIFEKDDVQSDLGVIGLNHTYMLSDRSYLQSSLSVSENGSGITGEKRDDEEEFYPYFDSRLRKTAARAGVNLYYKMDARNKLQTGILYTRFASNLLAGKEWMLKMPRENRRC